MKLYTSIWYASIVLALFIGATMVPGCSCCHKKSEVVSSGLKKTILQEAPAGAQQAKLGQKVTVHYTGWLEENGCLGHKFDSSVDRGTPFSFILGAGHVIKGWEEGVATMKVGEKCRLTVPAELGYGQRGFPGAIPGGATLIFDVELLAVS